MTDTEFFQQGPELENTWTGDAFLRNCLRRLLPPEVFADVEPGLATLGERAAEEMLSYAENAESHPPLHVPYDQWGRRVDKIRVSEGWKQLHRVAAEEGVVATAYERRHGDHSRAHQFARLYLYHPSSAICSCPLAMTDGAARVIEIHGSSEMRENAFRRLTSRDPETFWTSGQWMTERTGGSDVSGTSTIARRDSGNFRLYGTKWFTSATTSQMAFTLARIERDGEAEDALSLFYLELRDENDRLRDIQVHRLKDKLGTRALPTAELTMNGTPAVLVGAPGKGVRTIATLLNITRLYNACCAASQMRRAVALASDYALKRTAFGRPLHEHPLHRETLASLEAETRGATLMVFHAALLLGKEENGTASENERALLRLLTPLTKLYTAKQCVAVCSEALEAFGGAGYVEDTGLPVLLRDAQVLSIWEGTTNVLALDMLRAAGKDDSLPLLLEDLTKRIATADHPKLAEVQQQVSERLSSLSGIEFTDPTKARRNAFAIARVLGAVLLAQHAQWELQRADDVSLKPLEDWLQGKVLPE